MFSILMYETTPSFLNSNEDNYNFLDGSNNTGDGYNETMLFPTSGAIPHPEVRLPYRVLLSIAIYLTVVGILSTFGNILFILTVMRWRYLRNNSHMLLLLNMAVADLAISITGYPYTTISGYIGKWIFGPVMCQLYAFLCFTFSQVSMNTLVAVSVFRYIAICHPHRKHYLTSRTSLWALLIVWCHALFWTVSPLLGWSSYTFEPTRISCSFDWNDRTVGGIAYVLGTTLFCYLSHIGILVWCYKRIFHVVTRLQSKSKLRNNARWRKLRGNNATVTTFNSTLSGQSEDQQPSTFEEQDDSPPNSPPGLPRCQSLIVFSFVTENLTEMELHVLGMNVAMVVAFIVFWTPYAIISVISAFYDKLSPFWYIFPTIFAKTSCMINPILYGFTNSFLRKQLMLVLRGFLGLRTAIEDFEYMRQREQDGLYNKEGIFVGKRTGALCHCPCEGCVASRKEIRLFAEHEKVKILAVPPKQELTVVSRQKDERESPVSCYANGEAEGESGRSGEHEIPPSADHDNGHAPATTETVKIEKGTMLLTSHCRDHPLQPSMVKVKLVEGHHSNNALILNVSTLPMNVDEPEKGSGDGVGKNSTTNIAP